LFAGAGLWSGEERRLHPVQLLQITCGDLEGEDRVVHLAAAPHDCHPPHDWHHSSSARLRCTKRKEHASWGRPFRAWSRPLCMHTITRNIIARVRCLEGFVLCDWFFSFSGSPLPPGIVHAYVHCILGAVAALSVLRSAQMISHTIRQGVILHFMSA
jgi:hypothetical protein